MILGFALQPPSTAPAAASNVRFREHDNLGRTQRGRPPVPTPPAPIFTPDARRSTAGRDLELTFRLIQWTVELRKRTKPLAR